MEEERTEAAAAAAATGGAEGGGGGGLPAIGSSSSSGSPPGVYDILMSPALLQPFTQFCQQKACVENVHFMLEVLHFEKLPAEQMAAKAAHIFHKYVALNAEQQVNLDSPVTAEIEARLAKPTPTMFSAAKDFIAELLKADVLPKFLRSDHVQPLLRSWCSNTSSMEGDSLAAPPSTTTAATLSATSNTNASQPFAKIPTVAAKPLPFAIDSRHHSLLLAIDAVLHLIRLLFSVGMPSEESSFSPTEHTRAGALNAILQISETIRNSSVYQPVQPAEQSPEPNLKKQAVAARNVIEHHLLAWRKKFDPAFAQQATSGDCRTTTPCSNGVTETGIIAAMLWTLRKEATAHLHALADNDEYSLLVCNNSFQSVIAGQTSDVESIAVQQEITQLMDVLTLKLQSQDSQAHPSPSTALSATTTPTVQGITTKRRRKPSDPNTPISDEKLVLVGRILLLLTKQVASIEGQQDRELRVAEIELAKELVRATSANACLSDADRRHMRAVMLSAITQSRKRLSAGDLSDCSVLQALLQGYRNLRTITMY